MSKMEKINIRQSAFGLFKMERDPERDFHGPDQRPINFIRDFVHQSFDLRSWLPFMQLLFPSIHFIGT